MPRNGVQVAIRTRPTTHFAADQITINGNSVSVQQSEEGDVVSNKQDNWNFRFHHVLHNAGQDTTYDTLCAGIVSKATQGVNGTIMAYGQTGAGKTFTMIGDTRHYKHRGVAPRAMAQLFQEIADKPESTFQVDVSYMEIYNERIFDLLAEDESGMTGDFAVVEDRGSSGLGSYVKGLTRVPIDDEEQALDLLFQGEVRRTTAEHLLNKNSNRSHCIFTVYVTQRSRLGSAEKVLTSKLHLVDLAGSERLKKTMAEDERAGGGGVDEGLKRESMYINKSLTYLEQCVVALTDRTRTHVPYRQTKLTNVLRDSLGGNCATLMIACIWGESRHIEESISTLKLASRMMRVQNKTSTNVTMDPVKLVKKYEREIKTLKQELMMHDALADRSHVTYDEYTPEQQRELNKEVKEYLFCPAEQDQDKMPDIDSIRKVYEVLKQVKIIVRHLQTETEERLRTQYTLGPKAGAGGAGAGGDGESKAGGGGGGGGGGSGMVGDLDRTGAGFALGTAPAGARPPSAIMGAPGSGAAGGGGAAGMASPARTAGGGGGGGGDGADGGGKEAAAPAPAFKDREAAYRHYITTPDLGRELAAEVVSAKADVKTQRQAARKLARSVNESKRSIDRLEAALEEKRRYGAALAVAAAAEAAGDEDIVDEEEFRLMRELSAAKKAYRAAFQEVREAKGQLAEAANHLDELKAQLLGDFEVWFTTEAGGVAFDDDASAGEEEEEKGGGGGGDGGVGDEDDAGDVLDDGEAFDRLEMERVAAQDPDSLAYFNAQKRMQNTLRSTRRRGGRR